MKKAISLLFITLMMAFSACENLFYDSERQNTNADNFDVLWQTMKERYAFFDYKKINWDSLQTIYRPLALQANNVKNFLMSWPKCSIPLKTDMST